MLGQLFFRIILLETPFKLLTRLEADTRRSVSRRPIEAYLVHLLVLRQTFNIPTLHGVQAVDSGGPGEAASSA